MKISEDKIRSLTIEAINELGENSTPDSVKKLVEEKINKLLNSSGETTFNNENTNSSGRVILTAFGINHPGIVSSISNALSKNNCDIQDISQKIMQEFFTMIMLIDITNSPKDLKELQEHLSEVGKELKIKIYLQHEDLFRYMHRI